MDISKKSANTSLFSLEGNPSLNKTIPLSFQHILAMVVGNVLPALVLAGAIGLSTDQQILLVQACMFIAAIWDLYTNYSYIWNWCKTAFNYRCKLCLYTNYFSNW